MLGNLLDNAIKYSPNGGDILLTVWREDDGAGSWAVVQVRDHGLGIPSSSLERVFERFQRGDNVVGRIPGTGIGLTGVRQIVEQHGGAVSVDSREDEGSLFTVRLPLPSSIPCEARSLDTGIGADG
ncbi:MAG: ATP-binding protein [Chloroflexi bacterium]|nr:ATP-binding protein [Chloroflexota bacterium]